MKGIFKNYFICPKEKLHFLYNQISEIKELRNKLNQKKNIFVQNEQQQIQNHKENLTNYNNKLVKISSLNKIYNNKMFNHKKIRSFPKELKTTKNETSKAINYTRTHYRNFNSEKQLYIKDTKILKQFKKYKDIYENNKNNFEIVKNRFINDYKNNIKALNNYLSINDNRTLDNSTEENNNYKNDSINNPHKKNNFNKNKRISINTHIQLYSTNKEDKYSLINLNKRRNKSKTNKTFKEPYKSNYIKEKEKEILNNFNTLDINLIKNRKLKVYNCLSTGGNIKGKPKINQDCFLIMNDILGCEEIKIFGVFDGHGEHGDLLSQEIRDMIKEYFSNINYYENNKILNGINVYKYLSDNNYEKIYDIFSNIDEQIHRKYNSNDFCIRCGVTTNFLILFSVKKSINKIISINLGNTKSIQINNNNQIKQLNICHVPTIEEERKRIEKNGGEIGRAEWLNGGPLRIWFKGNKNSGLSITRSFGDFEVEKLGVNSIPDIKEYDIDEEKLKIIILATEGLWTFLRNEKIMDIVLPYFKNNDIKGATKKLTEIATNLWEINNPYEISDITIIILFFK